MNGDRGEREPRRPLLAHGERLTTMAERSRGGGPKYHPLTLDEAHRLLAPQAEALLVDVARIPTEARGAHVVIEATLHPNYLAASYHPDTLLQTTDLYVVGSRLSLGPLKTKKQTKEKQPTRTLLLAGAPESVNAFAELALTPPVSAVREWKELREFSALCVPSPGRVVLRHPELGAGEVITWESVLSPIGRSRDEREGWMEEVFEKWTRWIKRLGGEVATDFRRRVDDLTFVPIALNGEAIDAAAQFNLLRAIRPMPGVRTFPETVLRSTSRKMRLPEAATPLSPDVTISIFDGGVDATSPYFAPFVELDHLTSEPPQPAFVNHGTLVTSAALYGHVDPDKPLPQPIGRVRHYRVFPLPPARGGVNTDLYWVLDQMTETIKRDKCTLVNCSFGPDECVSDGEPTRWTAELDSLAHQVGVTILCAAGNNGEEDAVLGFNRVQVPADMVNGIGVGACDSSDRRKSPRRAAYSAVGPGRDGQRIQPTLVDFGGSTKEPFCGVDANGRALTSEGTSFSTPLTTRSFSDLHRSLDVGRRGPAFTRTFGVHFAERRRGHKVLELGHGRAPQGFGHIWDCSANACTVLYEQDLVRDGRPIAMRFPVPQGLAEGTKVEIDWTISYTTETDPKDPVDYTLCGLEATFRPHDRVFTLSDPAKERKSMTLNADTDRDQMTTLIAAGWSRSDLPCAQAGWRKKSEAKLRDDGKWETVLRGRFIGTSAKIFNPRLDVAYLRRSQGTLVSGSDVPKLRVSMLASIRTSVGIPLYDLIRSEFQVLVPLVSVQVPVKST